MTYPTLLAPCSGRISQFFGENHDYYKEKLGLDGHNGIDYAVAVGTPIKAGASGWVREAQMDDTGFGLYVKVMHAWGHTVYAHLSELRVKNGDEVVGGQVIGLSGNSGNSTGPHLHFGVRIEPYNRNDGWAGYSNPLPLLQHPKTGTALGEPTNVHQCFLGNVPDHYQAPTGLAAMHQNIVELPIEQIVTVEDSAGHCFAPGGVTSWSYLEDQGKELWGYFNAARPNGENTSTDLPHERDPQWFRREHTVYITENDMTVYDAATDTLYADPRSQKYKDYIIPKIITTGVKTIIFDNATLDSSTVSWAVQDWFEIYDALRAEGIKVLGNGLWQKDYAMEHCDGFQCELWTGNRPHFIKPDGQWGALTEHEFAAIARRWVEAGKVANMLVRWRPGESVFSNYDEFCRHYMELAETCGATPSFALHDYQRSGWRDWFSEHQGGEPEPLEEWVKRECDARQQVKLNTDAALQKAIFADNATPVENEFSLERDGIRYTMQKGERIYEPWSRYYYVTENDLSDVTSFP